MFTVPAGIYPPELVAACRKWAVTPRALLSWAVKPGEVILILPSGQKVFVRVDGDWSCQPAVPTQSGGERTAERTRPAARRKKPGA